MRSFRQIAVAAALASATVAAGFTPAFAGGAGAPDSAYSVNYKHHAQVRPRARNLYNYVAPSQQYQGGYDTGAVGGWW
jgi:hypothetical protein